MDGLILNAINCAGQAAIDLGFITVVVICAAALLFCIAALTEGFFCFIFEAFGKKLGAIILAAIFSIVLALYRTQA